jgi:hypothetical protein
MSAAPCSKAVSKARRNLEEEVKDEINSEDFLQKSLKKMQGVVKVPIKTFDDTGE